MISNWRVHVQQPLPTWMPSPQTPPFASAHHLPLHVAPLTACFHNLPELCSFSTVLAYFPHLFTLLSPVFFFTLNVLSITLIAVAEQPIGCTAAPHLLSPFSSGDLEVLQLLILCLQQIRIRCLLRSLRQPILPVWSRFFRLLSRSSLLSSTNNQRVSRLSQISRQLVCVELLELRNEVVHKNHSQNNFCRTQSFCESIPLRVLATSSSFSKVSAEQEHVKKQSFANHRKTAAAILYEEHKTLCRHRSSDIVLIRIDHQWLCRNFAQNRQVLESRSLTIATQGAILPRSVSRQQTRFCDLC